MSSPVEIAVETYMRAAGERDPIARSKLLEACFAEDGRIVVRSGVIRGRPATDAMFARFFADPRNLGFRMASAIDAAGTTFRYRSIVERSDGTSTEFFDAGEIDADGRITTLLVFTGAPARRPARLLRAEVLPGHAPEMGVTTERKLGNSAQFPGSNRRSPNTIQGPFEAVFLLGSGERFEDSQFRK